MFWTLYGINDIPETFINIIKLNEGIFIQFDNIDNVGCDARASFSRIALKIGLRVSSSAQLSSKSYTENLINPLYKIFIIFVKAKGGIIGFKFLFDQL